MALKNCCLINRYTTLCPFRANRILALENFRSRAELNLLIFAHPQSYKFQSKAKLKKMIKNEYWDEKIFFLSADRSVLIQFFCSDFWFFENWPKCLPKRKTFFENLEVCELITAEVIDYEISIKINSYRKIFPWVFGETWLKRFFFVPIRLKLLFRLCIL